MSERNIAPPHNQHSQTILSFSKLQNQDCIKAFECVSDSHQHINIEKIIQIARDVLSFHINFFNEISYLEHELN